MTAKPPARGAHARQLRIIAGRWRGRRWRFPDAQIRPTPDRVRETLFNWLQDRVGGRHCLDLFAGSGALGLEALSRGAGSVMFVDADRSATQALRQHLQEWGAEGATVREGDAMRVLAGPASPMDLVFLDPPFAAGLLTPVATALCANGWLAPGALVYVERAVAEPWQPPRDWEPLKDGSAGAVGYHLYQQRSAAKEQRP
jgi:16S rRNA (guanine966-N2)-methyltransferase